MEFALDDDVRVINPDLDEYGYTGMIIRIFDDGWLLVRMLFEDEEWERYSIFCRPSDLEKEG